MSGCEIEQLPGWECTRDFHHFGPCACQRIPYYMAVMDTPYPEFPNLVVQNRPSPQQTSNRMAGAELLQQQRDAGWNALDAVLKFCNEEGNDAATIARLKDVLYKNGVHERD
jgi:hypothetical protein